MTNQQVLFLCFGIPIFIVLLLAYLANEDNHRESTVGKIWEFCCGMFVASFGAFFIGGILLCIVSGIGENSLDREERVVSSYNLVALDTNEDMQGSYSSMFFVGSGHIGEEMYYHFYYETPKGIKYNKIRAEDCYIIETSDKPSYKKYGEFIKDTTAFFYDEGCQKDGRKVLYIPKGTIKSNYKVN